jgi:hypothetical protein
MRRDSGVLDRPGETKLQTEFSFRLPVGYLDKAGTLHREGTMRLATARDELLPLHDERVRANPPYLSVVLLARVVSRLGELGEIHTGVIENLFASDLAFLQDLYRKINTEGRAQMAVSCPSCSHDFSVQLGGASQGEL